MQYGPKIVTDSLVLALDAADNNSAPHNDLPVKQGCVTWLDGADDDVFSYSSGTLVSQWRDKSGNDNHVNQSTTSSQPTRNRTLNSKSVVDFDGSDDSLSSSNSLTLSSGHTMFAVTLTDAFSSDAGLISINNQLLNGITIHTSGLAYFYFGSGGYNTTQSVSTSTSYILTKVWTGATSGNRISYKNGTQGYSTGTMTNSSSTGVLRLGQQTTYYNGYIAEVVIYNRELSQDEITKVHNYLQNKWNISVSDTKWYDQTSNANNGTPTNDPTYSETDKGYFNFDGSDDYVDIGNTTDIFPSGSQSHSLTVSLWGKVASTSSNRILYGQQNVANERLYIGVLNGTWEFGWGAYAWGNGNSGSAAGATTNWTNLVLVVGNGVADLYVNGVGTISKTDTSVNLQGKHPIGAYFYLNSYDANLSNVCSVAQCSMYNKALSVAEVSQIFNATRSRFNI